MESAARQAVAGSGDSEHAIIKDHEARIRHVARPFAARGASFDDLVQEGRIALLKASRDWRVDGGASLWTYAYRFVLGAICRFVTKEIRQVSIRQAVDTEAGDGVADVSPEKSFSSLECESIFATELAKLSERERAVLDLRFRDGLDVRSIARELSLPKSTANDLLTGIVNKLRERVEARV